MSADEAGSAFTPKKGEVIIAVLSSTGLVEPRRTPGQSVGGSRGVSIRVAKGAFESAHPEVRTCRDPSSRRWLMKAK